MVAAEHHGHHIKGINFAYDVQWSLGSNALLIKELCSANISFHFSAEHKSGNLAYAPLNIIGEIYPLNKYPMSFSPPNKPIPSLIINHADDIVVHQSLILLMIEAMALSSDLIHNDQFILGEQL